MVGRAVVSGARPWVSASVAPVARARWDRVLDDVWVSGSAGIDPDPGLGFPDLLRVGDPVVLRLLGVDGLAAAADLVAALAKLPASVGWVEVDGADFFLADPTGAACWRLVLAGLAAHAQSRVQRQLPGGDRARPGTGERIGHLHPGCADPHQVGGAPAGRGRGGGVGPRAQCPSSVPPPDPGSSANWPARC